MMTADDLFKQKVQSYGFERKIYHATCTELMVFIHEGATPLYFNRDNGDGTYSHTHCAATFCTIIGPDLSGPFSILENLSDAVALIPNLLPRLTLTQSLLSLPLPSPPSKSAPFPLPQALYCCAALSDGGLPSYLPSCLNRYSRCHIGGK